VVKNEFLKKMKNFETTELMKNESARLTSCPEIIGIVSVITVTKKHFDLELGQKIKIKKLFCDHTYHF
jgi:hypothetical protein